MAIRELPVEDSVNDRMAYRALYAVVLPHELGISAAAFRLESDYPLVEKAVVAGKSLDDAIVNAAAFTSSAMATVLQAHPVVEMPS